MILSEACQIEMHATGISKTEAYKKNTTDGRVVAIVAYTFNAKSIVLVIACFFINIKEIANICMHEKHRFQAIFLIKHIENNPLFVLSDTMDMFYKI